jgi:LPXTG-motif cell wall-anchored protein
VNCESLPNTGLDANLGLFMFIAIGCVVLGVVALFASRRRRTGATASLMVLSMVVAAVVIAPETPARAETSDCGATENSLTVVQTSTMNGLAPGLAPVAITGRVVNNSTDSTYLTAVEVEIFSVTTHRGSRPGTCDASDYFLLNTRMPVGRTLSPGGSSPFTGASIGFRNKTTNQDACQRAVIYLLYTANPD